MQQRANAIVVQDIMQHLRLYSYVQAVMSAALLVQEHYLLIV